MNDSASSEVRVWVTLPHREPQLAEVPAAGEGNTERAVQEGVRRSSCSHVTSYRNKGHNCQECALLFARGMTVCTYT